MKRILVLILILLIHSQSLSGNERLTYSVPPSIWAYQQNGRLIGPIVDLLERLFSETGVKTVFRKLPWVRAMEQMRSGKLDMIPVIFFSRDRSRYISFSDPYFVGETVVFVSRGNGFEFRSLHDLMDRKGVMMRGDSISTEFRRLKKNLRIKEVTSYVQILAMLTDHRVEYGVAAKYGLLSEAKKNGMEKQVVSLSEPIARRSLCIGISKRSRFASYIPMINKRLNALKKDGTLLKIEARALETPLRK